MLTRDSDMNPVKLLVKQQQNKIFCCRFTYIPAYVNYMLIFFPFILQFYYMYNGWAGNQNEVIRLQVPWHQKGIGICFQNKNWHNNGWANKHIWAELIRSQSKNFYFRCITWITQKKELSCYMLNNLASQ